MHASRRARLPALLLRSSAAADAKKIFVNIISHNSFFRSSFSSSAANSQNLFPPSRFPSEGSIHSIFSRSRFQSSGEFITDNLLSRSRSSSRGGFIHNCGFRSRFSSCGAIAQNFIFRPRVSSSGGLVIQNLLFRSSISGGGTHNPFFRSSFSSLQQQQVKKRRGWISTIGRISFGGALIGGVGWIAVSDSPSRTVKLMFSVPLRLCRNVSTAAVIAADYKYSLYGLLEGSKEKEVAKHEVHLRSANRLQQLCFKNGGIYIKLGQHVGQLDYLVPQEYVQVMRSSMLDKCPVSSYKQVCDVFLAELGRLPQEVFAEFDPVPLASASLAQVHVARGKDGQKLAVKVQHMHLTDTAAADTATVDVIVNLLHWLFPTFDYRWLLDEVKESVPKELDFLNEAKNSELCVQNFARLSPKVAPQIVVPKVDYTLSTSKLLVMEFMEGVGVTDVGGIKGLGCRPVDVARLVSQAFAEMIFHHGFVHCDPHAANMKVMASPSSWWNVLGWWRKKPQLVLLDHGLYKTISPELRENYAGLWKALVFADVPRIKEYGVKVGAGEDLYVLFAGVLTMRPWDEIVVGTIDHLNLPDTPEGKAEIQNYAAQYFVEFTELLRRLPREVLLLLKTNDCLRAVDSALGAPVNTFVIIAREASKALVNIQAEKGFTLYSYCALLLDRVEVEFRILGLALTAWLASFRQRKAREKALEIPQVQS
ncbi:unnamed protein product [Calypogeia fissa]